MRPRRVEHAEERLDQPITDAAAHADSLDHLRGINRWLGGVRALRRALAPLLLPGSRTTLVDVGCGGADVAVALARWAAGRGAHLSIIAVDRGRSAAGIAKRRTRDLPQVQVLRADAGALPLPDRSVDAALMTLTLHHFDRAGREAVLGELARVSRALVVINDLERTWPNYLGARLLAATVWRSNHFTRHDAPLSVLRGFTSRELLADLRGAGLEGVHVQRRFFYRLLGTGVPPASDAAVSTLR